MRFTLPYSLADPTTHSHPCLAGDVSDDFLQTYWGNQHLFPGSFFPPGPLSGRCLCGAYNDSQNSQWVFDVSYDRCGTHVTEEQHGKVRVVVC